MSHRFTSVAALIAVTVSAWWGCCAMGPEIDSEMTMVSAAIHCPTAHLTMNSGHQVATVSEGKTQPVFVDFVADPRLVHEDSLTSANLNDQAVPPERDVGLAMFGYHYPRLIATVQPRAPSQPIV